MVELRQQRWTEIRGAGHSYLTYASFSDPDGWLLQEIKTRLPGREWVD